ncbi:hypothetical protein PYCC9005_003881 [Savitreella phatthalungensis]
MLSSLALLFAATGIVAGHYPASTIVPAPTTLNTSMAATPTANASTHSSLVCTDGSTLKVTSDCTYPTLTSTICYKEPTPTACPPGKYPYKAYNRCNYFWACADVPTTTSTCTSNGFTASTGTLFEGTLAGAPTPTTILQVRCVCDEGYYSYAPGISTTVINGTTSYSQASYCLPTLTAGQQDSCPTALTPSLSSFTITVSNTQAIGRTFTSCVYPPSQTPVFASDDKTPFICEPTPPPRTTN